jgi:hypothetical protein
VTSATKPSLPGGYAKEGIFRGPVTSDYGKSRWDLSPERPAGGLAATSDNRPIKRSWVFVEFPDGMLNGAIIDMVGDKYRLARGR